MKLPPASCGVSQILKHAELSELLAGLPLSLDIPFYRLPVRTFAHRRHIVPICPTLPTPQHPLDGWLPSKDSSGRDALENLHDPPRHHFRMSAAEEMNVIFVRPNRLHLNWKSLRNLDRCLSDSCGHLAIQQGLAIFHRKHNVVVGFPTHSAPLSSPPLLFYPSCTSGY